MQTVLFYLFGAFLVLGSFKVVLARDVVQAVLFLVFSFFQASALWLLLKAEFLAITLVLVYVGAVMVLFLFVVMMLDIKVESASKGRWINLPMAGLLALVVAVEIVGLVYGVTPQQSAVSPLDAAQLSNTQMLGQLLYTTYAVPVQIAAVILLVAIIAAIALTLRERKDSRHLNASDQVRVRSLDRLIVVPGFKRKA